MLLDIKVFGVNVEDWQKLHGYLSTKYVIVYSENGTAVELPPFSTIQERTKEKTVQVEIMLPGLVVRSHFFQIDEIEMDLRPEDVDSEEKSRAVFELMSGVARQLDKEVFLIPEYASASREELMRMVICYANPNTSEVICREGEAPIS